MSQCKENVKATLLNYLPNTSVQGVSHAQNAQSKRQRCFWIVIFIIGFTCCTWHVIYSIQNYIDSPVTSTFFFYEEVYKFPDVTFCHLTPSSQSIYRLYNQTLKDYWRDKWNYFKNWAGLTKEQLRHQVNSDVSDLELEELYRALLQGNLDLFWVSDAATEFGHSDYTLSSIYCKYNGKMCNRKDFKLIKTNKFWNCYTYTPPERALAKSQKNAALEIIVYTDTTTSMINPDNLTFVRESETLSIENYYQRYSINQIWNDPYGDGSAEGVRIYIHNPDEYPLFSKQYFDVPSGVHANVQVSETVYNKLKTAENPCLAEDNYDYAFFVTEFDRNATNVVRQKYLMTQLTKINTILQNVLYNQCKCYTHTLPFSCNITDLCFYVPPEERYYGSENRFNNKVLCHFLFMNNLEKNIANNPALLEYANKFKPCNTRQYSTQLTTCEWPKAQDITEFINLILIPSLTKPVNDTNRHEIIQINHKELSGGRVMQNEAVLKAVLDNANCDRQNKSGNLGKDKKDYWCTTANKIRDNFAYITIRPEFPAANKYEESVSKSWPEILGELGGTMGLVGSFSTQFHRIY